MLANSAGKNLEIARVIILTFAKCKPSWSFRILLHMLAETVKLC